MRGSRSMLITRPFMMLAVLASGFTGLVAGQGQAGTLAWGQTLPQDNPLYSQDGRAYLLVQSDGNLVLYSSQVANLFGRSFASAIYATKTYGATPGPFSLVMQLDCNLELQNGNSQTIFQSGTADQGSGPCRLVVSGAGGGGFAVVDSNNVALYTQGAYSPPGTVPGTLPANAVLTQDSKLFSWDGTVCLIAQSDGNVVLYTVALLAQYGSATAAAAVWDSGTISNGPQPYRLIMQSDCNLVMYDAGGTEFKDAIYYSATFGQGSPPCALTVGGAGGGFIRVSDSTYTALYVQPPSFDLLIDGGGNFSATPYRQQYQIFDANAGTASVTTTSPTLEQSDLRTLLPTRNLILANGFSNSTGNANVQPPAPGAELFNPATATWTRTGSPSIDRHQSALVSLFDGTALTFGGSAAAQPEGLATSEIYNPATGSWSLTAPMSTLRSFAKAAILQNGNVLTAGGDNRLNYPNAESSAEVFNVLSRTWTTVGNMSTVRETHQMTTLLDGRVLVSGGNFFGGTGNFFGGNFGNTPTCELYVPATSSFTATGTMVHARGEHRASLLPSGRVLVTGGGIANPVQFPTPPCTTPITCPSSLVTNTSEVYDPATGTWTPGPDMPYYRYGHDQVTLPSGQVFITGGFGNQDGGQNTDSLTASLLYNEKANAFTTTGSLPLVDQGSYATTAAVLFRH